MKKLTLTITESESVDGGVSMNFEFDPPLFEGEEYNSTPVALFSRHLFDALEKAIEACDGKIEEVKHGRS